MTPTDTLRALGYAVLFVVGAYALVVAATVYVPSKYIVDTLKSSEPETDRKPSVLA